LKPAIKTWVDRVREIAQTFPQKEEEYYLEQTLTGLLAGTAWSYGIRAITEVRVKRTGMDREKNNGRLDLLLSTDKHRVAIEAKIQWDWTLIPENALAELQNACSEVASIEGDIADTRLGMLFFVPWPTSEDQRKQLSKVIVPCLSKMLVEAKAGYYNATLPYPGAMLFAKMARKR